VGTFREVAAYTKEAGELTLETVKDRNTITITPHLDLDKELFNMPLTMVVERDQLKQVSVVQGQNELPVKLLPGKAIFDFDPYGGNIVIKVK